MTFITDNPLNDAQDYLHSLDKLPVEERVKAWNPVFDYTYENERDCVKDIHPHPHVYVPFIMVRQYCAYVAITLELNSKQEKELLNELINRYKNGNKNS